MAKDTKKCTCAQVKKVTICYKDAKHPFHRLPFVADDLSSFWDVPATGGYEGGWRTGKALGYMYIQYLAAHNESCGTLSIIVLDMAAALAAKWVGKKEAGQAQILGFISVIEQYATRSARYRRVITTGANLIEEANDGLNFDEIAYINQMIDYA